MNKKSHLGQEAAVVWSDRSEGNTAACSCDVRDAERWLDVVADDALVDLDLAALLMPAALHLANVRQCAA